MRESDVAKLAELTAEELVARGERLLALGRELMGIAGSLAGSGTELAPHEARKLDRQERTIGKGGVIVTEATVLNKTRELGKFTIAELADKLGIGAADTMKWVSRLLARDPPVIERQPTGAIQSLLPPDLQHWILWRNGDPFTAEEAKDATGLEDHDLTAQLDGLVNRGIIEEDEGLYQYVAPDGDQPAHARTLSPRPNGGDMSLATGQPVRIRTEREQRKARSTPGQRQKIINNERNWQKLQDAKAARAAANRDRGEKGK